jgi:hypothetical protein
MDGPRARGMPTIPSFMDDQKLEYIFKLYQGLILPDFTVPLLFVTASFYGKTSRSECFLMQNEKIAYQRALRYRWTDDWGMKFQQLHDLQTLVDFEVFQATKVIEKELGERYHHDAQIARVYCPYQFKLVDDPKSFLVSKHLMHDLPTLEPLKASRCRLLRDLVDEISHISPLVAEIDDKWYEQD